MRRRLLLSCGPWIGFALVLLLAPLAWPGGFALTVLSQVGIAIILCLSYNLLFGEGGMLSFGHAVHSGAGAYAAILALDHIAQGTLVLPVSLVPLAGGLAGLAVAAAVGWACTRHGGTAFAMITLGLGELVGAMVLMLPQVFGGEGGRSASRVVGPEVLGISFGPQRQLCLLIALYCLACTALMFAFTRTSAGLLLNAVRDNAERVGFLGHSAHRIRWQAFMIAGFFAGIAGGLAALDLETVTAEVVSAQRSGAVLLFVLLGGSGVFFGPILGAVLMVGSALLLPTWTRAGTLYLGLLFMVTVIAAPDGLAGLLVALRRAAACPRRRPLLGAGIGLAGTALCALAGLTALVELLYQRQLDAVGGAPAHLLGVPLDAAQADAWVGAALVMLTGAGLFAQAWGPWRRQWAAAAETDTRPGRSA